MQDCCPKVERIISLSKTTGYIVPLKFFITPENQKAINEMASNIKNKGILTTIKMIKFRYYLVCLRAKQLEHQFLL